jgi:hypothetical protein
MAPDVYSHRDASKLLTERADAPWARYWPGCVARFVLDRIDEKALRLSHSSTNERGRLYHDWYSQFYIGVREYANGNLARFADCMRRTCEVSNADFDPTHQAFINRLCNNEFYLARHESRRVGAA